MQQLSTNLKKMDAGASKLNDSLKTLTSQSDSLTSGSAQAVYSSLPATQRAIVDATDKIAGKDFTQISFASDENMDKNRRNLYR